MKRTSVHRLAPATISAASPAGMVKVCVDPSLIVSVLFGSNVTAFPFANTSAMKPFPSVPIETADPIVTPAPVTSMTVMLSVATRL